MDDSFFLLVLAQHVPGDPAFPQHPFLSQEQGKYIPSCGEKPYPPVTAHIQDVLVLILVVPARVPQEHFIQSLLPDFPQVHNEHAGIDIPVHGGKVCPFPPFLPFRLLHQVNPDVPAPCQAAVPQVCQV